MEDGGKEGGRGRKGGWRNGRWGKKIELIK
jgi:hypothetical protein